MVMFDKQKGMWDLGLLNGTGKNEVEARPAFSIFSEVVQGERGKVLQASPGRWLLVEPDGLDRGDERGGQWWSNDNRKRSRFWKTSGKLPPEKKKEI